MSVPSLAAPLPIANGTVLVDFGRVSLRRRSWAAWERAVDDAAEVDLLLGSTAGVHACWTSEAMDDVAVLALLVAGARNAVCNVNGDCVVHNEGQVEESARNMAWPASWTNEQFPLPFHLTVDQTFATFTKFPHPVPADSHLLRGSFDCDAADFSLELVAFLPARIQDKTLRNAEPATMATYDVEIGSDSTGTVVINVPDELHGFGFITDQKLHCSVSFSLHEGQLVAASMPREVAATMPTRHIGP